MKIAIAIVVKDESTDILPWICWYFRLNADTIIVYDDSSTDGTYELLKDVSSIRDVRLRRVAPSIELYTQRQNRCYIRTLEEYAEEFDWIGFFDADEYLALPEGQDLSRFLDRPDTIGAVAINWCNYGSSGHVLKPRMPPFYAYNLHYAQENGINRHVKSFVRPAKWDKQWHNPHFFGVGPLSYVDPAGRPVQWSTTPGITGKAASFEGAKLMHYQCRSMEHFVERIRKRPDIPAHPSLWASYDHGETEDNTPRNYYEPVAEIMYGAIKAVVARVIHAYSDDHRQEARRRATLPNFAARPFSAPSDRSLSQVDASTHDTNCAVSVEIRKVVTHFGTTLGTSPLSPRIRGQHDVEVPADDGAVFALFFSDAPEKLFLLAAVDHKTPLLIEDDPRVCDLLVYEAVAIEETGLIALRHPVTRMYLSCEPPEIGGALLATRTLIREWEKFSLARLSQADPDLHEDPRVRMLHRFARSNRDLQKFFFDHHDTDLEILSSIFPALVSVAVPRQAESLRGLCGAAIRYVA